MWTDDIPTITGLNEFNIWIHLELITFNEQRKHQKRYSITNRKVRNKAVRVSRNEEVKKIMSYANDNNPVLCFCTIKDKHVHIIIRWLMWVKKIPVVVKKYIDYGDKYEYQEINENDFKDWWRKLPDFAR